MPIVGSPSNPQVCLNKPPGLSPRRCALRTQSLALSFATWFAVPRSLEVRSSGMRAVSFSKSGRLVPRLAAGLQGTFNPEFS